ncbi:hypothetical protein J2067_001942 [Erwinia rhapontici]|nr:hypothetical protein [Erwinia rhapontici]
MPQKRATTYHVVKPGDPHPMGWTVPPVNDLRSAIELLKTLPG